jgi:hypothetical protein
LVNLHVGIGVILQRQVYLQLLFPNCSFQQQTSLAAAATVSSAAARIHCCRFSLSGPHLASAVAAVSVLSINAEAVSMEALRNLSAKYGHVYVATEESRLQFSSRWFALCVIKV